MTHINILNNLLTIPSFDLDDTIIQDILYLQKFKTSGLRGSSPPRLFYVIRELFEIVETVGSARIEGNNTTVIDYIESGNSESDREEIKEIVNIQEAQAFIRDHFKEGKLSKKLICELHTLIVKDLKREGARVTGDYRSTNVRVGNHEAPNHILINELMEKLIDFINTDNQRQYDIIKIAIFHHAFLYIHPFDNGNGRLVRLLTYALLIQFGFHIELIFNPSAVFYMDREKYANNLSNADLGDNREWVLYFSSGLCQQFRTVETLANYETLFQTVIVPSIKMAIADGVLTNEEAELVLSVLDGTNKVDIEAFKLGDINPGKMNDRKKGQLLKDLREKEIVIPLRENGREYRLTMRHFRKQLFKKLRELNLVELD